LHHLIWRRFFMSAPATSLLAFGAYLLVLGTALVLVPNEFLAVFGIPPTPDVWLRVVGMLLLYLGTYDILAARREWRPFFLASVYLRSSVIVFFMAFVALGLAPPMLLLFGALDFAAALWTAFALRSSPVGVVVGLNS
jgi:hypothetical protein